MAAIPAWLALDRAAGDLEGQIYRSLRDRILDGRLTAPQSLPPSRALAAALGVARSTVVNAYDRLKAEGYLEGRPGSATRVAAVVPRPTAPAAAAAIAPAPGAGAPRHRFSPGVPDLGSFPYADWAACLRAAARSVRAADLGYAGTAGLPELRAAIVDHVAAMRGVSATPERVLVLPSTRAAVDLLARVLLPPGGTVWMEEPGYASARAVFQAAGARLVPVACDAQGIDVAAAAGAPLPGLIYTTPSHQYPTGVTMTLPRRLALLDLARISGAVVVEDDYDSEFHYAGRPIAALQGIDRAGVVVYLGTFSKTLAPGLRVAYLIAPPALLPTLAEAHRRGGAAVSGHVQAALARFMRDGRLRAHLRRMIPAYAERRAAVTTALEARLGHLLTTGPTAEGGLQLASWFRDPATDDAAAARRLAAEGYGPEPMSGFHLGPPRPGLLFGIADVDPARIDAAMARIAAVLERR
jgi:GntR family transcriptional regulator/MocR family aminotransferase